MDSGYREINSEGILLSICIPTYNRCVFLLESLKILVPQIKKNPKIELLINDNASKDDTVKVIREHIATENWNINLKVYSQEINPAENFKNVVERSNGKYVFLLGDDDLLSPNFISIIIPILEKGEIDILHFNRLTGNKSCSDNKLHDREFDGLQEVLTFPDFIRRVMSSPNFMSSLIFKKEIWMRGSKTTLIDKYYGYEWLSRIYFGADNNCKCLYYYMPLVIMRNPERTWSKNAFLFTMVGMYNIFDDLDRQIPGVRNLWVHRVRHSHYYDFILSLSDIGRHPETYRPFKKEILKICINKKERFYVKLLLNNPLGSLTPRIYIKAVAVGRLLSNKYSFVRKVLF